MKIKEATAELVAINKAIMWLAVSFGLIILVAAVIGALAAAGVKLSY